MSELKRIEQDQCEMSAFACFALERLCNDAAYCRQELPGIFEDWCYLTGHEHHELKSVLDFVHKVAEVQ